MKIFYTTDHDSHWPVGCASLVIADDETEAIMLLDIKLETCGLKPYSREPYTLIEVLLEKKAYVLNSGNY